MSRRPVAFASTVLAALAAAVPASADTLSKPHDVQRVERAVIELAAAKRQATGDVEAGKRAAQRALGPCRSSGRGWAKIRSIRVRAQRNVYARGARALWNDLGAVAAERAALDAYRPGFERFLSRFDAPLDDPILQAGANAWRRRIALYEAYTPVGTCKVFNAVAGRAKQFPQTVEADYLASQIYERMTGFVAARKQSAARKQWGSRYEAALGAARDHLIALGGNQGYATFFAFGYSLRG